MPARSAPAVYSRPVAPDDLVMLAAPDGLVTEIQLCVEGDGAIDAAALTAAVAAAAGAVGWTAARLRPSASGRGAWTATASTRRYCAARWPARTGRAAR